VARSPLAQRPASADSRKPRHRSNVAQTHFHAALDAKLRQVIEDRNQSIASGKCEDFSHYRFETGYVAGLQAARNLADELEREFD